MITPFQLNIGDEFSLGSKPIGQAGDYTLLAILSVVIKNLYVLAGVVLLFMLFAGGVGMIVNAGNAEKQKQSGKTLTSAVMGFAILIAAYWLVKIIEIIFGLEILAPQL